MHLHNIFKNTLFIYQFSRNFGDVSPELWMRFWIFLSPLHVRYIRRCISLEIYQRLHLPRRYLLPYGDNRKIVKPEYRLGINLFLLSILASIIVYDLFCHYFYFLKHQPIFFNYFPFTLRTIRSSFNSSILYVPLEKTWIIWKGPSHLGDHLPNALSFQSMGMITFQIKSSNENVLIFTILLYAFSTLFFCLFNNSKGFNLSSSKSTNSSNIMFQ